MPGGNVGIGSTSPSTKLQLPSGEIGIGQQNDATPYMRLGMDSSWQQYLATNAYWNGSAYNYVNTAGYNGTASMIRQETGNVCIVTASGGTNPISWNERFTVLGGSGNVGIGTTSPSQSLDIVGNINLSGTIIQPGWTAVPYQNSWTDWAGGYAPAAYFKDNNGVVHLRGTMRSGTCFAAAFSLPAGYRPAYNIILAGSSNNAYSRLDITPTGAVLPGGCNGCGGTCNTGWYSVEGVTFMSEQ